MKLGRPRLICTTLVLSLCLFVLVVANVAYERYEVTQTQRCVKVVGKTYYQSKMFGIIGYLHEYQEYAVLADGREILWDDAIKHILHSSDDDYYCDYVYEKVKKN